MRSTKRCPECSKRVPYAIQRCLGCGTGVGEGGGRYFAGRPDGRRAGLAVLLALLVLLIVGISRNLAALGDWYMDAAMGNLRGSSSQLAATPDDRTAFLECARWVVREMEAGSSVATFASGQTPVLIGEGRYEIRSQLEESLEGGTTRRRGFICTLRPDSSRSGWLVEDLELEPVMEPSGGGAFAIGRS